MSEPIAEEKKNTFMSDWTGLLRLLLVVAIPIIGFAWNTSAKIHDLEMNLIQEIRNVEKYFQNHIILDSRVQSQENADLINLKEQVSEYHLQFRDHVKGHHKD